MFSVSSTEFAALPGFIEKVSKVSSDSDQSFSAAFDELRTWAAEQNMLVHYSKIPSVGSSGSVFFTLKYDRSKLTDQQYASLGRFRSVTFDSTGKVCCVSPPKMLKLEDAHLSIDVNSAGGYLFAEEFVEGVMFNLFHSEGKWFVSTKSCVGEVSYEYLKESAVVDEATETAAETAAETATATATATPTSKRIPIQEMLRRRICDTLALSDNGLSAVPTEYCYSFILQHPKNQIVNQITSPKLYLIGVYQVTQFTTEETASGRVGCNVIRLERDIFSKSFVGSVYHMPSSLTCVVDETDDTTATFKPHTVADYCKLYGSHDTRGASLPGVVFRDGDTGFCYKRRNPKYESVKKRKGMELKLLSQYLFLRKERSIDEFLKYHPQHNRTFNEFRERLHDYTLRLYEAYISHYVKKEKPLKEYERELRSHMYKLHYDVFLATMKESGSFVTKHTAINYVNNLAPAQQLACLNLSGYKQPTKGGGSGGGGGGGTASGSSSGNGFAKTNSFSREAAASGETGEQNRRFLPRPSSSSGGHGSGSGSGSGSRGGGRGGATLADRGGFRTNSGSGSGYGNGRGHSGSGTYTPSIHITRPSSSSQGQSVEHERGGDRGSKGIKSATPGLVKVQNRFAGLNVD